MPKIHSMSVNKTTAVRFLFNDLIPPTEILSL